MARERRSLKTAGDRLAYVIDMTGLRQRIFAERIGIHESHLSAVKHGKAPLTKRQAG